jgi:chromate transporter
VVGGETMSATDLVDLFAHFAMLSLLSIGGALGTSPEMHRFLVESRGWIDHRQFTDSITLAQTAPGPNILFVTLLGWETAGAIGAAATTLGIMLPSSLITLYAHRLKTAHEDSRIVTAIRLGLSPIAIGMTTSAGWIVAASNDVNLRLAALTAVTMVVVLRTKFNPLWLIAAGAILGASGLLD